MNDTTSISTSVRRQRPGLSVKIEGPRVGEARLSANDLATIIVRTQQALKRIGEVLYGESSIGQGRKKKDIEKLCELFIVGWKPGSAVAEVELAEPPAQMGLFGNIGEESLKTFLTGMNQIAREPIETLEMLPRGFDPGVVQSCVVLGRVLDHGIERVTFQPIQLGAEVPVTFDRPLRERIRGLLGKPIDERHVEKTGCLEVLNGHRGLQGRLCEPDGTTWICIFRPEHMELLRDSWLHTVRIVGEVVIEPNRARVLNVMSIVPLEEEIAGSARGEETKRVPFWVSLPLHELAELQSVQPADDLDQISALWPVDDDPDQILAHILEERSARRRLAQEEHDQ